MNIERRLKGLEHSAIKARAEWEGSLTDEQLREVIYSALPGYPDIERVPLSTEQLKRIAAGEAPATVIGGNERLQ